MRKNTGLYKHDVAVTPFGQKGALTYSMRTTNIRSFYRNMYTNLDDLPLVITVRDKPTYLLTRVPEFIESHRCERCDVMETKLVDGGYYCAKHSYLI